MTIRTSIAAEQLSELDVHEGDVLRVVEVTGENLLIELRRDDAPAKPDPARAAEWLRSAKGIVNAEPGESVDDLRMAHHAAKFQLKD